MSKNTNIPERSQVAENDKWDLSLLYKSDSEWDKGLKQLEEAIPRAEQFKGHLEDSVEKLKEALDFIVSETGLLEERLGYYAMLRREENVGDSETGGRYNRLINISTKYYSAVSYFDPEIQSIPDKTMEAFLKSGKLDDYKIYLQKLLRFKPHTLSEKEERLLAMQSEFSGTPRKAFSSLTNVDMDFGTVQTSKGEVPLTNTTFGLLTQDKDREVRKTAFNQFYTVFDQHKNTLGELYNGSVQKDVYHSRVRGYSSSRAMALFPDNVPEEVYDNLVKAVNSKLDVLHSYYELRKEVLGLEKFYRYDTTVSLIPDVETHYSYEEAVDIISQAVSPLGEEYVSTLTQGLLKDRWVDRYENKGKRSGAFSAGSFTGNPYILMNYKEDDIRHIFTLIHEGGHSMHSWYSSRNNPFPHYSYTIFEAEVASTFNEQLLAAHMLKTTSDPKQKKYLIGRLMQDIIGTIYRQTMFAEYEQITHTMAEAGQPLTIDSLRSEYRTLQEKYHGSALVLQEKDDLEGLRIPHFYRAFYVYKYATGLSAAIALSRKVLNGGDQEKNDYLNFLKSGGSQFPLDSLKIAGVDMSRPEPIQDALDYFGELLEEFRKLE